MNANATIPHYDVSKHTKLSKCWILRRVDQTCHIGLFPTRKSAVMTGQILAGWRGLVTINGRKPR